MHGYTSTKIELLHLSHAASGYDGVTLDKRQNILSEESYES